MENKKRLSLHKRIVDKLEFIIEHEDRIKLLIQDISKLKPVELKNVITYEFEGADLIRQINMCRNRILRTEEEIAKIYSEILWYGKF